MLEPSLIMRIEDWRGVLPPGIHIRFATPHPLWGCRWTTFTTGLAGVVFLPSHWCGQSVVNCEVYDSKGQLHAHYDVPFQFPAHAKAVVVLKVHPSPPSWWQRWIQDFLIKGLAPLPRALARRITYSDVEQTLQDQTAFLSRLGGRRLDLEEEITDADS